MSEFLEPQPASRLTGLRPYSAERGRWSIDLRLDANEAGDGGDPRERRYPDASGLESALAAHWTVAPDQVVVTNGGDDAIDRVCRAVMEPGRTCVLHDPTFGMIAHGVRLAGGEVRAVPWLDGPFPMEDMVAAVDASTSLIALVSPNNPTGCRVPKSSIDALLVRAREVGALVMLDAAYGEFDTGDPSCHYLNDPNIVLVRTFSKAFGLAGLRVGYAITTARVAEWLRTVGGPYPVSGASLDAAEEALARRSDRKEYVDRVRTERALLRSETERLGGTALESCSNSVLLRFGDSAFVRDAMASVGVGVRGFPSSETLQDWLRVTVPGAPEAFERLLRAVRTAVRPEGLLLDMDGVLADVSASYRAAIIAAAETYGVTVTRAQIASAKAAGDANNDWVLTQRLLCDAGRDVTLDEVVSRFQGVYLGDDARPGLRDRECLIPTAELVRSLVDRIPTAIVTGRPRDEAAWFLERAGLGDCFDVLVAMEDGPPKPSPEPLWLAMEQLGVETAWMVGDTPDDARAARAAGVVPLGVIAPEDAGGSGVLEGAGVARVLDGLGDLLEMLG